MHRPVLLFPALAGLLAVLLSGCSKNEAPAAAAPPATAAVSPPAPAAVAPPSTGSAHANPNRGKVLQVLGGSGYTYAEVEVASGQRGWIAGSQIAIKPGDSVEWGTYSVMRNFTARSLGRTFDEILFVDQWGPAGGAVVATSPHAPMAGGAAAASPHGAMTAVAPGAAGPADGGVVRSVSVAGGYSYVEVDRGGTTVWVAAVETPLKAGDRIRWQGGSEMRNFTAKSIGRTFDRIVFASSLDVVR